MECRPPLAGEQGEQQHERLSCRPVVSFFLTIRVAATAVSGRLRCNITLVATRVLKNDIASSVVCGSQVETSNLTSRQADGPGNHHQ